ncbi:MAG: alpha/beta fold hydrolase [Gaiellaceae bacterium]
MFAGVRTGGLAAGLATIAAALVAASAAPASSTDDPLFYCNGSPDGGATGQLTTDQEHTVLLGDPPLPAGARQERVKVDGITTTVTEAGPPDATRAVVFAHGSPDYSRDFDHLLSGLAPYGRVISFDWPGYGHADDPPAGPYNLDGAAHFLGGLLDRLGVRSVDLVMHDFGGPWALQWAAAHPDQLNSATIIDSGVFIGYAGHPAALLWITPGVGEASMMTTTRREFAESINSGSPEPMPQDWLDRTYDQYDRGTRCALLHYYRDIGHRTPDAVGRAQAKVLSQRRRPALVVWGEKDPYIPVDEAYKQSQAFPGARVEVVKGAGHWPHVDHSREVDDLVVPFLRGVMTRAPAATAAPRAHARSHRAHHRHHVRRTSRRR